MILNLQSSCFPFLLLVRCRSRTPEEEEVLFIGTQFSNLSTAVDTGEEGERERERAGKVLHYSLGY